MTIPFQYGLFDPRLTFEEYLMDWSIMIVTFLVIRIGLAWFYGMCLDLQKKKKSPRGERK